MNEKLRLFAVTDFFIVPVCAAILYMIAYRVRRKYKGTVIHQYFMPALSIRFLFTILYAVTIEYYYRGGDTSMFFQALHDMQNAVGDDPSMLRDIYLKAELEPTDRLVNYFMYDRTGITHYYMYQVSNYMVPKFGLPFSMIFFRSYLSISFCMTFFAFAGCWRLFKMLYILYPHLHKKIAVAILFLPSVLFWSGALMKDSICMGAFGFFVYALFQVFILKKKFISSLLIMIASGFLLFYIKPYIILCVFPAFLVWMFFILNKRIRDRGLRMAATFAFSLAAIIASLFFMQRIASSEIASQYAIQNIVDALESQQGTYSHAEDIGSYFTVGQVDNSFGGLLLLFPAGIVASLFRPFLWEVSSPIMLLTALESLAFLWLTIQCFRYTRFKRFRNILKDNPVLVFCLIYSLLFAGLVGMTTLNFGTLARYKIPALPLYLIFLFVILDKSGRVSPKIILHKRLF